jgi:hypothetical protein
MQQTHTMALQGATHDASDDFQVTIDALDHKADHSTNGSIGKQSRTSATASPHQLSAASRNRTSSQAIIQLHVRVCRRCACSHCLQLQSESLHHQRHVNSSDV